MTDNGGPRPDPMLQRLVAAAEANPSSGVQVTLFVPFGQAYGEIVPRVLHSQEVRGYLIDNGLMDVAAQFGDLDMDDKSGAPEFVHLGIGSRTETTHDGRIPQLRVTRIRLADVSAWHIDG
jgi:hypothetical protein